MAIAYLGPRGSFSEVAAITFNPAGEHIPYPSFPAVVAAVEAHQAAQGMLAIENSIEGAVSANIDLLIHDTDLKMSREIIVPVRHSLIAAPGATLGDIQVVESHPQALAQCRKWLDAHLPGASVVAALSTSGAVEAVAGSGDRSRAAIGTERAAELYQGEVLAKDIHDVRANVTRFAVLAHEDSPQTGDDKTSIGFTVKRNLPGALHRVMSAFAYPGIQLTKAESRPTKAWLGDYVFLFDMEGHRLDPRVALAIEQAHEGCDWLKVFGSYPRFPMESLREFLDFDDPAASERMGMIK